MNWDELQNVWKTQPAAPCGNALPPEPELLARVQRTGRRFDRTIFWRDAREVAVGLFVMALFSRAAWEWGASGWPAWLAVAITGAVTAGIVVQRRRLQRARAGFDHTIAGELGWSLHHLRGQIRILHNIFWTYALPLGVAGVLLVLGLILRNGQLGWRAAVVLGATILLQGAVTGAITWLNRLVARTTLLPKLRELEKMEADLTGSGRQLPG